MRFAKSTCGFYDPSIHGNAIPADAIEITDAEYRGLLDVCSAGKVLSADAAGRPIAVDPPAPDSNRMAADNGRELRQRRFADLAKTDPTAALLMLQEHIQ